jgi:hypothetical protein
MNFVRSELPRKPLALVLHPSMQAFLIKPLPAPAVSDRSAPLKSTKFPSLLEIPNRIGSKRSLA